MQDETLLVGETPLPGQASLLPPGRSLPSPVFPGEKGEGSATVSGSPEPILEPEVPVPSAEAEEVPEGPKPGNVLPADADVPTLLKEFVRQPGGKQFRGDSRRLHLLEEFLWVRQLAPGLSFSRFLERYAELTDEDGASRHPAELVKRYLPRGRKQAEDTGTRQWTAKEATEYLSLYIDMVQAAERQRLPVPLSLEEFLQSETMIERFLAGEFRPPRRKPGPRKKRARQTAAEPGGMVSGQRVVYTEVGGRQYRGVVREVHTDGSGVQYADFESDAGELFRGLSVGQLAPCSDPQESGPKSPDGEPLTRLAGGRLTLRKADRAAVERWLGSPGAVGSVALGEVLHAVQHAFPDGRYARVALVNGETGVYVAGWLLAEDQEKILASVPPRRNLEGRYWFVTAGGYYELTVR